MERMATAPGQDPAEAAQSFAKALHDAWGVGDAQCNNGVLLLLSIGDRQVLHCSLLQHSFHVSTASSSDF